MARSFIEKKDNGIGELENRMRRMEGTKHRRDATDFDDELRPPPPVPPIHPEDDKSSKIPPQLSQKVQPVKSSKMVQDPTKSKQQPPRKPRPNTLPNLGSDGSAPGRGISSNAPRSKIKPGHNSSIKSSPKSPSPKAFPSPKASPSPKSPSPKSFPSPKASPSPKSSPSPKASPSPRSSCSPSPRPSPVRQFSHGSSPKKIRSPTSPTTNSGGQGKTTADLSNPEVLARLGNRATKTVNNHPSRSCDRCKKPLTDDGCLAFGKMFHKNCFRCKICQKKLEGKFLSKGEDPFCEKCYKTNQEICCVCQLKITGDCVLSNNKNYHPGCIMCYICGDPLKGQYFTFMGNPICETDYQNCKQTCALCNEVIDGTYYTLNGKVYCQKDYQEQMDTCDKCGEIIDGEHIDTDKSIFHPDCFNCHICEKNIIGMPFFTDDAALVYCTPCYNKKLAAICSVCTKAIVPKEGQTTAPRLLALGKVFHLSCYKCEDCGKVLDSTPKGKFQCYPIKNHVLCKTCNELRQERSEEESD